MEIRILGLLAATPLAEAFDLFCRADRKVALGGEDLDALAEAAFWLGRTHEAHLVRQRAHAALLAEGQRRGPRWWPSSSARTTARGAA